jgi:hypothetical protein
MRLVLTEQVTLRTVTGQILARFEASAMSGVVYSARPLQTPAQTGNPTIIGREETLALDIYGAGLAAFYAIKNTHEVHVEQTLRMNGVLHVRHIRFASARRCEFVSDEEGREILSLLFCSVMDSRGESVRPSRLTISAGTQRVTAVCLSVEEALVYEQSPYQNPLTLRAYRRVRGYRRRFTVSLDPSISERMGFLTALESILLEESQFLNSTTIYAENGNSQSFREVVLLQNELEKRDLAGEFVLGRSVVLEFIDRDATTVPIAPASLVLQYAGSSNAVEILGVTSPDVELTEFYQFGTGDFVQWNAPRLMVIATSPPRARLALNVPQGATAVRAVARRGRQRGDLAISFSTLFLNQASEQ